MGSAYSRSLDDTLHPPPGYVVPEFPSLYNPRRDFHNKIPVQYLFSASDIFRFTLYWTLIFYAATYGLCGIWAGLIAGYASHRKKRRAMIAILAMLPFWIFGTLAAVVGSAVTGYVLAAVYSVGLFTMSTWVPFLWAIVLTSISIMGSYSTVLTFM